MNTQAVAANYRSFSMGFFSALAGAMTEASGSPWLVAAVPDAVLNPEDTLPVWSKLTLGGSLEGELLLEFGRAEATVLLSKCSRQPIDEFGEEQAEALLKVIRAATSEFLTVIGQEYGSFTIEASSASEPLSETAHVVQMTAADGDSDRLTVSMHLSPEIARSLSLHAQAVSAGSDGAKRAKTAPHDSTPDPVNLKLVMDVELNVTLRFGQRQLTLREVLELTTGSVVELDRHVEEPVELLLEGRVIARGEAVVIDGNYGLRVTEVSQSISSPLFS